METKKRTASKRSGRLDGVTSHDSAWLLSAMKELRDVRKTIIRDHGKETETEVEFAILWAGNLLTAYDAGHCTLRDLLDGTNRAGSKLPAPMDRLLLGVVARSALKTTPKSLGEHKAKTVPAYVLMVGSLVQSFLFDENGEQPAGREVDAAVALAIKVFGERNLMAKLPADPAATFKQWHADWREIERAAGRHVASPRRGRPIKG